jgi:hypothetical protein
MTLASHVWCRIFLAKGIYNIGVSAVMLAWTDAFLPLIGTPPGNMAYPLLFLWLALACGVGYIVVALDLDANRGVVVLGIIGQLAVFGVLALYWLKGSVHAAGLIPACVDLAFAIAFGVFLWTHPYRVPAVK